MQFLGKPPVGVIFDSDMGENIDAALALAVLYGLDGKNETRVVSLSVSKSNLKSAAFSEAIGRFYAGAASGAFGAVGRTLPVGMSIAGKLPNDTPMLTEPLARRDEKGEPVYNPGIQRLVDTAEVPALIRNAFTGQYDQNTMVVVAGPLTNLAKVLELHGAKDWIIQKVRLLAVAAGAYLDGPVEPRIKTDVAAARKVFAEWPTPIVAVGTELGQALPFPASSIEKDFAWSQAHPVVDGYRAFKPMPYDAPSAAVAAVLYAVRPNEGYFKLSDPGAINVLDDGRTRFAPSADGKRRYLIFDPAQKDRIVKAYTELASAKPVVRQRFRPSQKKEEQPPEKKDTPQKP